MATLTGKKPKNTFKDLLQVSNSNSGIDATKRAVSDGEGTASPLELSSSAVNISSGFEIAGVALTATAAEINVLDQMGAGAILIGDGSGASQVITAFASASGGLLGSKLTPLSVSAAVIKASAVATAKIAPLAVTTEKIAANAVDGTKIAMGSDAQGDVLYYGGTDYVRLAASSGQFLKSNGAGQNPAWAAPNTITQAVESDIVAETNQDTYIPPDLMKFNPGVAKVWAHITGTSSPSLDVPSQNVSSITDSGVGLRTINLATAFASAVYVPIAAPATSGSYACQVASLASASYAIKSILTTNGAATDIPNLTTAAWGVLS